MDNARILKSLNDNSVDYVVIGAVAMAVHGYARTTLDLDIFVRPDRAQMERALCALATLGYGTDDVNRDTMLHRKLLFRGYAAEVDIHPFVTGTTFDDIWRHRIREDYLEVPISIPSLDHMIVMKRAAGRPQDLEDLRRLEILRARKGRADSDGSP